LARNQGPHVGLHWVPHSNLQEKALTFRELARLRLRNSRLSSSVGVGKQRGAAPSTGIGVSKACAALLEIAVLFSVFFWIFFTSVATDSRYTTNFLARRATVPRAFLTSRSSFPSCHIATPPILDIAHHVIRFRQWRLRPEQQFIDFWWLWLDSDHEHRYVTRSRNSRFPPPSPLVAIEPLLSTLLRLLHVFFSNQCSG